MRGLRLVGTVALLLGLLASGVAPAAASHVAPTGGTDSAVGAALYINGVLPS